MCFQPEIYLRFVAFRCNLYLRQADKIADVKGDCHRGFSFLADLARVVQLRNYRALSGE